MSRAIGRVARCERPDPKGVVVNIEKVAKKYSDDVREGYEIALADVPKDVKVIRFVNSY